MIKIMTVGAIQEHTYFFIDEATKHAFVIDPGAEADRLLKFIENEGLVIEKILLTHGHYDHISAVKALKEALNCPVYIHTEGKTYLEDTRYNLSPMFGDHLTLEADVYVEHGEIIELEANSKMNLRVIFAPGHTADGVAFYNEADKVAFVGDIIFAGSVGRSDHPGGDANRLLNSIRAQIFTLPDDTVIYPGHGESTTVRTEKATNPFFNLYE